MSRMELLKIIGLGVFRDSSCENGPATVLNLHKRLIALREPFVTVLSDDG